MLKCLLSQHEKCKKAEVPGLNSEVPGLRPGQTRPNLTTTGYNLLIS